MKKKAAVRRRVAYVAVAAIMIAIGMVATYELLPSPVPPQRTVEIQIVARQWWFDASLLTSTDPGAVVKTLPTAYSFANTTIVVRKGDLVTIHLQTADVAHGFAIEGYSNVGPYEVAPGQTVTFSFTASQAGVFTFYCTVFCGPGHPNHKGTLIVLE